MGKICYEKNGKKMCEERLKTKFIHTVCTIKILQSIVVDITIGCRARYDHCRECYEVCVKNSVLYIIVMNVMIFYCKYKLYFFLLRSFVIILYIDPLYAPFLYVCTVAAPKT